MPLVLVMILMSRQEPEVPGDSRQRTYCAVRLPRRGTPNWKSLSMNSLSGIEILLEALLGVITISCVTRSVCEHRKFERDYKKRYPDVAARVRRKLPYCLTLWPLYCASFMESEFDDKELVRLFKKIIYHEVCALLAGLLFVYILLR